MIESAEVETEAGTIGDPLEDKLDLEGLALLEIAALDGLLMGETTEVEGLALLDGTGVGEGDALVMLEVEIEETAMTLLEMLDEGVT